MPKIADGKIISAIYGCSIAGTAGGCYILAHDVETGDEVWRFNTIDDPNNPGSRQAGAAFRLKPLGRHAWTTGAYDPETNTTYWGIGMPGPYAELIRGSGDGSVLYTNSTLALDAATGELQVVLPALAARTTGTWTRRLNACSSTRKSMASCTRCW